MSKFDMKLEAWRDQQARGNYPDDCQPLAERAATDYDNRKVTVDDLLREWGGDEPTDEAWEANLGDGVRLLPESVYDTNWQLVLYEIIKDHTPGGIRLPDVVKLMKSKRIKFSETQIEMELKKLIKDGQIKKNGPRYSWKNLMPPLRETKKTFFRIRPYSGDARRWAEFNWDALGFDFDKDRSTQDEVFAWSADGNPDIEVANLLKARDIEFDMFQDDVPEAFREDSEEPVEYAAVDGAGKTLAAVKATTEDGARQLLLDRLRKKKKEMDTWQGAGERVVRQKVDPTPPPDTGEFMESVNESLSTYHKMKLSPKDEAVLKAFQSKRMAHGDILDTDGTFLTLNGLKQASWAREGLGSSNFRIGFISQRVDPKLQDHILATFPKKMLGRSVVAAFFEDRLNRYENLTNAQIEERFDRVMARSRYGEANFARFMAESNLPPRARREILDSHHVDRRYVILGEELTVGLRMPDNGWCLLGE